MQLFIHRIFLETACIIGCHISRLQRSLVITFEAKGYSLPLALKKEISVIAHE